MYRVNISIKAVTSPELDIHSTDINVQIITECNTPMY